MIHSLCDNKIQTKKMQMSEMQASVVEPCKQAQTMFILQMSKLGDIQEKEIKKQA